MESFSTNYNSFIVTLSVVIAIIYSFTAFDLFSRKHDENSKNGIPWLLAAAFTLGTGYWTMHFVGMLAIKLSSPVDYRLIGVVLTLGIAITGSAVTLAVIKKRESNVYSVALGSIFMSATALMVHFAGMAAVNFNATITYNSFLLTLAITVLLVFSFFSLWVLCYEQRFFKTPLLKKLVASIIAGTGISFMHYTTLIAASFTPISSGQEVFSGYSFEKDFAAPFLIITALVIVTVLVLISVMRDRQLARKATELIESENRYNSMVENNPDGVFLIDMYGHFIRINRALEDITGYTAEEAMNQPFLNLIPEDYHEQTFRCFEDTKKGQPQKCETMVHHKYGDKVVLKITTIPHIVNGKVKGIIGIAKDVTELNMAEELIRRSEKLTAVGELAAGVAHEIRNPLTSLKGFTSILHSSSEDKKNKEFLEIMLSEIDRINFIVSEFMMLAKPDKKNFQTQNLISILQHVIALLGTQAIMKNIRLIPEYEVNQIQVDCEENQLKQVFVNVIKNAIEAMEGGGKVQVKVNLHDQNRVKISIIDHGTGIPKDKLDKVGQPFFTLKESGTGLGLMVSFKIIQNHNGIMQIESKENKGTKVEIILPIKKNEQNT
ncbi:MHYT domain-containing protein [Pseudalkalibacillus caeni]|uniref:histidine kinase n=1 Tax=Exobacillus caeni TaxID=2574798 RepID=A0A5R9F4J0_9BACL|nr:MHYT domain-containing protein [Pseudalkalibacillus caeni]TLS37941.1 PAS domain S-box protein [Pseudalkalibacillus caeni]